MKPLKRFGQNFLQNLEIAHDIVDSLHLTSSDVLVEIGPGKGVLSRIIVNRGFLKYMAVEIDSRFETELNSIFLKRNECSFVIKDIQKFSFHEFSTETGTQIKVIGNIPYNITSTILFQLLDNHQSISLAILMMQKEVVDRLMARPGTKQYGILTVLIGNQAITERLREVKAENFYPKPEVDSAVVKIKFFKPLEPDIEGFRKFVKNCFRTRRKTLKNNLLRFIQPKILSQLESVSLLKRPEELSVSEFRILFNEIRSKVA